MMTKKRGTFRYEQQGILTRRADPAAGFWAKKQKSRLQTPGKFEYPRKMYI